MSLVDEFIRLSAPGDAVSVQTARAAEELSRVFGRRYRAYRVHDWRAGRRPVPPDVRDHMLGCVTDALYERGVITHATEAYHSLRDPQLQDKRETQHE